MQAHACSALTNFLEGVDPEVAAGIMDTVMSKLEALITNGISIVKESGITTYATLGESAKDKFVGYYGRFITFIFQFLVSNYEPCYR